MTEGPVLQTAARSDDLDRQSAAWGLPEPDDSARRQWAHSQASFPDRVVFLEPAEIGAGCARAGLPADLRDAAVAATGVYDRHPGLRRLAWHLHRQLSVAAFLEPAQIRWPKPPAALGPGAAFVTFHVLLAQIPATLAFHADRGIPHRVSLDTFDDLRVWSIDHRRRQGEDGFSNPGWLTNHVLGRIYRLGRLQFDFSSFSAEMRVLRHRRDGRIVTLAADGQRFRGDGLYDGSDGVADPATGFTTTFANDGTSIVGHPVTPRGAALRDTVSMAATDWQLALAKGTPALGIHIAADGPMDHAACGESVRQAIEFFPRHFPERHPAAFTCWSWLMDPQFEAALPSHSNIVRFLSEFHLLPTPNANDRQTIDRVFGGPIPDLDCAPQESSLQRAIVAHMRAGGRWRDAYGFILLDDLAWGSQAYRRSPSPLDR
jgi:hypothetical protein